MKQKEKLQGDTVFIEEEKFKLSFKMQIKCTALPVCQTRGSVLCPPHLSQSSWEFREGGPMFPTYE